jgi:S1-C subfamily serine protease
MGVGSGGVVGHGSSSTYILTAKHVMASLMLTPQISNVLLERLIYENASGTNLTSESVQKLVHEGSVRFVPVGFEYFVDFSDGVQSQVLQADCDIDNDICLIEVSHQADVARIVLSSIPPYVGEKVLCASAPFGQAIPELQVVPLFHGIYSGTDIKTPEYPAHSWYTFPSTPGSSGSLILNKNGELVGVVIGMSIGHFCGGDAGCAPMHSGITIAVPHFAIAEFLSKRLK